MLLPEPTFSLYFALKILGLLKNIYSFLNIDQLIKILLKAWILQCGRVRFLEQQGAGLSEPQGAGAKHE
jgi:hypothetical protein